MTEEQKLTFTQWMIECRKYAKTLPIGLRGFYRVILSKSNESCWHDYYDGGYTPKEAIGEDMTYLD